VSEHEKAALSASGEASRGASDACVFIRELTGWRGDACLVRRGSDYFVVSSVDAYSGPETLAFRTDSQGEVTDWHEAAGWRGASREEVIAELAALAAISEQAGEQRA
jgi:hypothetical protein